MMIFFVWSCVTTTPSEWSSTRVLEAHRARLDQDGDGRISETEYERTLWNGPPFGSADEDRDGDLSVVELEDLTRHQSPSRFDGPFSGASVREAEAGVVMPTDGQRDLSEVLNWMVETLVAAGEPVPAEAEVQAAIQSGDWKDAHTTEVLKNIKTSWEKAGLKWPEGLQ